MKSKPKFVLAELRNVELKVKMVCPFALLLATENFISFTFQFSQPTEITMKIMKGVQRLRPL